MREVTDAVRASPPATTDAAPTTVDITTIAWEQLEKEIPLSLVEYTDGSFAVVPKSRFGERPSGTHEGRIKMCLDGGPDDELLRLLP